jgi:hypothetical protein
LCAEKLDGVPIAPFMSQGKLRFAAKTGLGNALSKQAQEFVDSCKDVPYEQFCLRWVEEGFTPIFEYLSPKKKVNSLSLFPHFRSHLKKLVGGGLQTRIAGVDCNSKEFDGEVFAVRRN